MYEPMVGVENVKGDNETSFRTLRSRLKQTPAADAVEVICCKNCDLWNTRDKQGELCRCIRFTFDISYPAYTRPNDFCSYAVQR